MEFSDKVKGYLEYPLNTAVRTKFLTLTEQATMKNILQSNIYFQLYGGYQNSELKRAVIFQDADPYITCFKITYNRKYLTLTHQNILGTLLSLSITKDSIGDILANQDIFFITSELSQYIKQEFTSINRVAIGLTEIDGSDIMKDISLDINHFSVSSLRLDSIVRQITKKSRNSASEMIENDLIQVNHLLVNKNTKLMKEEDILSIRKFGRFKILDTKKTSKKGKIVVKYGKYI